MTSRSRVLGATLLLLGVALWSVAPESRAAADDKIPFSIGTSTVQPAAPAGVLLGEQSRLPYPVGADRWVDAAGADAVTVNIPGVGFTAIRRQAAMVYRPQGDRMRWEDVTSMCVKAGVLPPNPEPKLTLTKVPEGEGAAVGNAFEDRIYRTRTPGEHLAMGLIRNLRSQHLLVYEMLLTSKLNDAQALLYARGTVEGLAEEARQRRMQLPAPPGGTPLGSVIRLQGAQVRQLQQALARDPNISPAVRRMADVVLPQATTVTRSAWRTAVPLADKEFFDFYTAQAKLRGYPAPISRDESHPERPTLLLQRPYNSGVTLVRAQPSPAGEGGGAAGTTVYVFDMDGSINVDALVTK